MTIKSFRDYMVRIQQVLNDGLLVDRGYSLSDQKNIMQFVEDNKEKLRELSIRVVLKIAKCYKMGSNWQKIARITCLKN